MLYTNNSFPLSHFLWFKFSHNGGCDDRTWELSLSHLRRSCLCLTFSFFLCACACARVCILSQSHNSSFWTQNMQTLFMVLLAICFLQLLQGSKKRIRIVLEIQSLLFAASVILICFVWQLFIENPCLFICGFLIFRSHSLLSLALSVCVGWNRMAACMQEWVSSVQKYSILSS